MASQKPMSQRPELDPNTPIYLGDVFWPPTMSFMAWLPSEVQQELEVRIERPPNIQLVWSPTHLCPHSRFTFLPLELYLTCLLCFLFCVLRQMKGRRYGRLRDTSGAIVQQMPQTTSSSPSLASTACRSTTTSPTPHTSRAKANRTLLARSRRSPRALERAKA